MFKTKEAWLRTLLLTCTSLALLVSALTAATILLDLLLKPWGSALSAAQLQWLLRSIMIAAGLGLATVILENRGRKK